MKSQLLILFQILAISTLFSQEDAIQKQIDKDVWYPFMESYADLDAKAFMAVHTDDIIRINRDGKRIRLGAEYAEAMEKSNQRSKEREVKRTIQFSFLERIAREDIAFEVGYYKVIDNRPGKPTGTFYGKFQVIIKKVDGTWKLWVDSDTSIGGTITEEDFLKGEVLSK